MEESEKVQVGRRFYGQRAVWLAVAGVLALAISVGSFLIWRLLGDVRSYGYLGVFIATFLGSASIVLPLPGAAAVFTGGWLLNPLLVGLVAGIGEALGELTGYVVGYEGRAALDSNRLYQRLRGWMAGRGAIVIFIASAVPNPFFDVIGVAAGALSMPIWQFFLASWAGKTIKSLYFAYAGAWGIDFILRLLG